MSFIITKEQIVFVLLGIADANYRFLYVNVGCQGRISDGGVFKNTFFYMKLEKNELTLPENEPLPSRTLSLPYVLLADDTFPLTEHILKPYNTDLNKGSPKMYTITGFPECVVLLKIHLGYFLLCLEFSASQ